MNECQKQKSFVMLVPVGKTQFYSKINPRLAGAFMESLWKDRAGYLLIILRYS